MEQPAALARCRPQAQPRRRDEAELELELELELKVRHLAQTLAWLPARFHDRREGARWGVVGWRMIPLVGAGLMIAGAAVFAKLKPGLAADSVFHILIFHAPPILMVALLCMNALPRVEIPPTPKRPRQAPWRQPRLDGGAA